LPEPWMRVVAAILAGIAIASGANVGHEAAHRNLFRSNRANLLAAIVAFAPALINYRLWIYDHHFLHHPFTNGKQAATYKPLSKAQFDRLALWRQWLERVYRAPLVINFGLYYLLERWIKVDFCCREGLPPRLRGSARRHFIGLLAYAFLFNVLLVWMGRIAEMTPAMSLLLGFALPFFSHLCVFGATLYLQHNHPRLAWFDHDVDRLHFGRTELLSVEIALPRLISMMTLGTLHHPAHHLHPRIPGCRLREAQQWLNAELGELAITEPFSLRGLVNTMRCCKLYDYRLHRWLDFDGRPTTETVPLVLAARSSIPS
jgi:acyl-lipid omega-6 desaturase (Delta-12 desaturase)